MQPSDEELVTAYLENGDERAFRQLVERHQNRIFGYLMGMVKNRATANDLFQETFERVIGAMQNGDYTQQGQWLNWVMSIARNATIDHTRKQKKWVDVPHEPEGGRSFWDTLEDDAPSADEQLHRTEQREWLDEHIEQLAPEQREVLLLRQETDLTFREIAELQDVSINTALGRMRYALKNLRKMMEKSDKTSLAGTPNS
ncbi:MAG: sigma-70 family RNA polymerase sigma factor [Salinivenus sp.]